MTEYDRFWSDILTLDYETLRQIGERIVDYMEADPDDMPDLRDPLAVADFLYQIAANERDAKELN